MQCISIIIILMMSCSNASDTELLVKRYLKAVNHIEILDRPLSVLVLVSSSTCQTCQKKMLSKIEDENNKDIIFIIGARSPINRNQIRYNHTIIDTTNLIDRLTIHNSEIAVVYLRYDKIDSLKLVGLDNVDSFQF